MSILLGLAGIVCSIFMLKYRERLGDLVGEAEWMNKVGGVYSLIIIIALLLFFWSVAVMTGTTDIFLTPILWLLPIQNTNGPGPEVL
jgi:hypothetical protein